MNSIVVFLNILCIVTVHFWPRKDIVDLCQKVIELIDEVSSAANDDKQFQKNKPGGAVKTLKHLDYLRKQYIDMKKRSKAICEGKEFGWQPHQEPMKLTEDLIKIDEINSENDDVEMNRKDNMDDNSDIESDNEETDDDLDVDDNNTVSDLNLCLTTNVKDK